MLKWLLESKRRRIPELQNAYMDWLLNMESVGNSGKDTTAAVQQSAGTPCAGFLSRLLDSDTVILNNFLDGCLFFQCASIPTSVYSGDPDLVLGVAIILRSYSW